MECSQFRARYDRWWNQGPVDNRYPPEQQDWFRHLQECRDCHDWSRRRYCLDRGIDPAAHCCLEMAWAIAHPVETLHQGRNRILDWDAPWNEYLIPISYDGYKATVIRFCPWCGAQLPASRRKQWYDTLYALGYNDPGEQEIPAEFRSDRWWRGLGREP